MLLTTWHDDPWARGAYSLATPDGALDDPALREPVGRLAFAGEHTAGDWHGLMEGALRSGERAAADVERLLAREASAGDASGSNGNIGRGRRRNGSDSRLAELGPGVSATTLRSVTRANPAR